MVNEKFIPLIKSTSRYNILYGGRGSSKSSFISKLIVFKMLQGGDFRGVLIRNVFGTIKDSSFEMIKRAIEDMGLGELFKITISPLEINCYNGAKLLCRGMDEPSKIKSLNANFAWWEEDIPKDEGEWISVSAGIRNSKQPVQEWFTINPEVDGHYEDNWFWKKFFKANVSEQSFENKIIIPPSSINKKETNLSYTVHHSTYKDNRWLTDDYRESLKNLKDSNPYYYTIYAEGNWGVKENLSGYYKLFNRGTSVYSVSEIKYNQELPLFLSFDFNVNPGMHTTVWQIDGLTASCINEIITKTPSNNTMGMCKEIIRQYKEHSAGFIIMGDASGRHGDTRTEEGVNDYKIIMNYLSSYSPQLRVPSKNPYLGVRGDFINSIFAFENKDGIIIKISDKCVQLITDLIFVKEAPDRTKLKQQTAKEGEKYGHASDTMDYFICSAFEKYFRQYTRGGKKFQYKQGVHVPSDKFSF